MVGTARILMVLAGLNGALSVVAGAFGAHALKARLTPDLLAVFDTGARYHMYHSLGLAAVALIASPRPSATIHAAGWAMLVGIVLFSGSLYVLALSGVRAFGAITPLGGGAFVAGWLLLAIAALR